MNRIKIGIGPTYEFTHDIVRNSSLELEDRDRLPSKVVQDIDLTMLSSSNFSASRILTYLTIPATDS